MSRQPLSAPRHQRQTTHHTVDPSRKSIASDGDPAFQQSAPCVYKGLQPLPGLSDSPPPFGNEARSPWTCMR